AKAKGIRTCTENHGFLFQSPERVEELILAVGNENYGWLCDMGNFLCADEDVVKSVSIAAPYAFHAHVKDFLWKPGTEDAPVGFFMTRGKNHIRGTIVGHGVVPVRNCIGILKSAGYNNWLSIEFFQSLCQPVVNIRRIFRSDWPSAVRVNCPVSLPFLSSLLLALMRK
ncbi:MAG: sugar phosphate isomerase/epimerase, partial [Odoribacter sp.]|nr:sugar phosphate isomerase/epimerase [Odoribacter sp.]